VGILIIIGFTIIFCATLLWGGRELFLTFSQYESLQIKYCRASIGELILQISNNGARDVKIIVIKVGNLEEIDLEQIGGILIPIGKTITIEIQPVYQWPLVVGSIIEIQMISNSGKKYGYLTTVELGKEALRYEPGAKLELQLVVEPEGLPEVGDSWSIDVYLINYTVSHKVTVGSQQFLLQRIKLRPINATIIMKLKGGSEEEIYCARSNCSIRYQKEHIPISFQAFQKELNLYSKLHLVKGEFISKATADQRAQVVMMMFIPYLSAVISSIIMIFKHSMSTLSLFVLILQALLAVLYSSFLYWWETAKGYGPSKEINIAGVFYIDSSILLNIIIVGTFILGLFAGLLLKFKRQHIK
jgi:hypothetical protein